MNNFAQCFPACLMAQKLNNRAAALIESGNYDVAIEELTNAMKLSQEDDPNNVCDCSTCTLESCMSFSKRMSQGNERMQIDDDEKTPETQGYIFQQPIRVPPSSMSHSMGLILPLLITFNLALAHQLGAMDEYIHGVDRRQKLQRSLRLYELAYRWQMEEEVQSLGFNMILANNLGEIHKAAKNHRKHRKCLRHLLSTMMYVLVVDDDEECIEMDGFFQNTSSLIFAGGCAAAA